MNDQSNNDWLRSKREHEFVARELDVEPWHDENFEWAVNQVLRAWLAGDCGHIRDSIRLMGEIPGDLRSRAIREATWRKYGKDGL